MADRKSNSCEVAMPEQVKIEMIACDKLEGMEYFLRVSKDEKPIFWVTRNGEIGWPGEKEKALRHAWLIGCVCLKLISVDDYKRLMGDDKLAVVIGPSPGVEGVYAPREEGAEK